MTDKELLREIISYIEDCETRGVGYDKRDYYRDLKDLLIERKMPAIYYSCLARLKRLESNNH